MFPIPDPSRLFPRKPPAPTGGADIKSPAEALLLVGEFGLALAAAIVVGSVAAAWSPWLGIPAALAGLFAMIGLCETTTLVCGILEAACYGAITFVLSDGFDRADATPSWIGAGAVAAVFLWATFAAIRARRC